jgi:hypothetical protein
MYVLWIPKYQRLQQYGEMGCGVAVFAELTGLTREEILLDQPKAEEAGLPVIEWEGYLINKGFEIRRYDSDKCGYTRPCAHLMRIGLEIFHWIYEDCDGHILDPGSTSCYTPPEDPQLLPPDDPRLKGSAQKSIYCERVLTLVVTKKET